MYSAPSVTFPVGRCRFYAWLLMALAVASAFVLGVWAALVQSGPQGAWGLALWALWSAFAAGSWWRSPVGQLRWEPGVAAQRVEPPGGWWWRSATSPHGVPLRQGTKGVDMQSHGLLSLRSADALTRWVWVERARDPMRWPDLRRALMSHT